MAYIREKTEERTCYQCGGFLTGNIDYQNDVVLCYRVEETIYDRIKQYRENGYEIHFMTGISWGAYEEYFDGRYDSRDHSDEVQTDRFGNKILHSPTRPYLVPSIEFADYLTEKLKLVVDAGALAIHVEEPEFWNRAGYSEWFKREYKLFYREDWSEPHLSFEVSYKAAKLKAYLFRRTIDRVSSALKEYAMKKYNRVLRFYVPTHSLLNYTQWKIMSPESSLADVESVDGFIAQVWTGTSREKNFYNGKLKERTFETAYLEYGVMQELVKGTGKTMWFLHDPIEDNPIFDWNDYRYNYLKTVTASLLHGSINKFEICPWPNRVFNEKYPKNTPEAQFIPAEYATLLNGLFQTLGDMESIKTDNAAVPGVLMSDTALYQREYPDSFFGDNIEEIQGTVLRDDDDNLTKISDRIVNGCNDEKDIFRLVRSNAFPSFYGLTLPLIKNGLHVQPVVIDNARRYNGYLNDKKILIMSYEFMKPTSPDINGAVAAFVMGGGRLLYIGDGSDPYFSVKSWWSDKYENPAQQLFVSLGLDKNCPDGTYSAGLGKITVWNINPAYIAVKKELADIYRTKVSDIITEIGSEWNKTDCLMLRRGNYIVAAVTDESEKNEPVEINGLFADMYTPDFRITRKKVLCPDDNTLLYDIDTLQADELRIIGTCARIFSLKDDGDKIRAEIHGSDGFYAYIRIHVPYKIASAVIRFEGENEEKIEAEYDEQSSTVLLSYESKAKRAEIILYK